MQFTKYLNTNNCFGLFPKNRLRLILWPKDLNVQKKDMPSHSWNKYCRIKCGMQLSDLIIVYFACGAPFSAYLITQTRRWSLPNFVRIAARLLLWPYFAGKLVVEKLVGESARQQQLDRKIAIIQSGIEEIAFSTESPVAIFEFRETFTRYTGLTRSIAEENATTPPKDLFAVSGHSDAALAANVLDRRNRERIKFHQACARNEFVDMIAEVSRANDNAVAIDALANELMDLLNDPTMLEEVTRETYEIHKKKKVQPASFVS